MKKAPLIVIAALAAVATCLAVTGCKTSTKSTPVVTQNLDGSFTTNFVLTTNATVLGVPVTALSIYNGLRSGTASATRIAQVADTNTLAYAKALRTVIGDAISSTNYNPAALTAAVDAIPLTGIQNPKALAYIQSGFAAFAIIQPIIDAQAKTVLGTKSQFVTAALQGIYDGLGDAIGLPAAPIPTFGNAAICLPFKESCAFASWQSKYLDGRHITAAKYEKLGMIHVVTAGSIWPSKEIILSDWGYSKSSGEMLECKPVNTQATTVEEISLK